MYTYYEMERKRVKLLGTLTILAILLKRRTLVYVYMCIIYICDSMVGKDCIHI